jgi:hypothetical protein
MTMLRTTSKSDVPCAVVLQSVAAAGWAVVALVTLASAPADLNAEDIPAPAPVTQEGSTAQPRTDDAVESAIVLFTTQYASEYTSDGILWGWFAIPFACVDPGGTFIQTSASCVGSRSQTMTLYSTDTDEQVSPLGSMTNVYDSYARGLPLSGEPNAHLLSSVDRDVAPPRPVCTSRTGAMEVPPAPEAELARIVESTATSHAAEALARPWIATGYLEADLDGDGQGDRLFSGRFESDVEGAANCEVVVALWGNRDSAPSLLEFACDDADYWSLTGRAGPFNLDGSSCWDLNRDGRVELWLSTGFDSERGYEFVEMRDHTLVRAGDTVSFGD